MEDNYNGDYVDDCDDEKLEEESDEVHGHVHEGFDKF